MYLLGDSLPFSRLPSDAKTVELLLRRQQKRRLTISRTEKLPLLSLVEQFRPIVEPPKAQLERLILVFKPDTLLHQTQVDLQLASEGRGDPVKTQIIQLGIQRTRENPWGDDHITGELKKLGYRISLETVHQILRRDGVRPVPQRKLSST